MKREADLSMAGRARRALRALAARLTRVVGQGTLRAFGGGGVAPEPPVLAPPDPRCVPGPEGCRCPPMVWGGHACVQARRMQEAIDAEILRRMYAAAVFGGDPDPMAFRGGLPWRATVRFDHETRVARGVLHGL